MFSTLHPVRLHERFKLWDDLEGFSEAWSVERRTIRTLCVVKLSKRTSSENSSKSSF